MDEFKNHTKPLVWGVGLVLFAGALFLFAMAATTMRQYQFVGQGIDFRNTITVEGKGEITAKPDIGEFSFSILEEAKTATAAQTQLTNKMNKVIAAVKALGVDDKDIKTEGYNVSPKYDYTLMQPCSYGMPCTQKEQLVGYTASHNVTVKIRNLDKTGDIVAAVTPLGVNNVSNVNFTFDDPQAKQDEARQKAIVDAKTKAVKLASDLGVSIISVVTFNDSSPQFYPMMAQGKAMSADAGGMPPPSPVIPSGENKLSANVSITYAIR